MNASRDKFLALFTKVLLLWLCGYAVLGKGFAYVPVGPVYIGEVLVGLSVAVLLFRSACILKLLAPGRAAWIVWSIVMLALWCGIRTLQDVAVYRLDSFRDAAVWGYSVVGLAVYSVIATRPSTVDTLLESFKTYAAFFPIVGFILLTIEIAAPPLPEIAPGVPILTLKGGDLAVHLGAIALFYLLKLRQQTSVVIPIFLLPSVVLIAVSSRGGAAAFAGAVVFALFGKTRIVRQVLIMGIVVLGGATLMLIGELDIQLFQHRAVSVNQLTHNIMSIVNDDPDLAGNVSGTKRWRLEWWEKIVNETVYGEFFWTGRGFGPNLAAVHGFESTDKRLRSPHNIHMTYLARGGVPGAILWMSLLGSVYVSILKAYTRARQQRREEQALLCVFIAGYITAIVVNATFDVYLEGPMGSIWFWALVGIAAGITRIRQHQAKPSSARWAEAIRRQDRDAHLNHSQSVQV
jgi:hypothetical protein